MNCENARDLLLAEQDDLLEAGERAELRAHLETCPECRAEQAAIREAYTVLIGGVREMVEPIVPSAAFWQSLTAELDAIDAARLPASARRPALLIAWRRRAVAGVVLLAAAVASVLAVAGPQNAWAAVRHLLYAVPFVGLWLGQVAPTALVVTAPQTTSNGAVRLTVTGLVAGRRATLLSYALSGNALASGSPAASVADAVDAALIGAHGRRYVATYWVPVTRSIERGVPVVRGAIGFTALASDEKSVRLVAVRLPYAPLAARPWSLTLPLQQAAASAALTAIPVDRGEVYGGVRLSVTDVTYARGATVVDLSSQIVGGLYSGGTVTSLTPETALGAFAPFIRRAHQGTIAAAPTTLQPLLRQALLTQPEFVFPIVPRSRAGLALVVPSLGVQMRASAGLIVRDGMAPRTVALGTTTITIARTQVVTPPAGLGLGDERRLRLTLAFPAARAAGTLQSVSIVAAGVSQSVSRDDPRIEIPLTGGQRGVSISVENPLIGVRGPWTISLDPPAP